MSRAGVNAPGVAGSMADWHSGRERRFGAAAGALGGWWPASGSAAAGASLGAALVAAAVSEIEARRLFLWVPVAAGAGVVLYFAADREPALWLTAFLATGFAGLAVLARRRLVVFGLCVALSAVFAGMLSAGLRSARVAAPVIDRIRIATLSGFVEQVDHRREGARIVLRITKADGLAPDVTPSRARLTTRRDFPFEAGAHVSLKARLLPPAHAALPGGYDFARDAYFQRIGAVGSLLGKAQALAAPEPPGFLARIGAGVDRLRNGLAHRVRASVEGDSGAIAVAMVTGKRDFLSEDARDLVREAGIFHIITISGVQMTLVAGILFFTARLVLAMLPGFALRYPIKRWAAGFAIVGAIAYDVLTGSRVGTERALIMTMIVFGAVLVGRPAITMRNLALAALVVIALEPEAIMGASFQLSFAAVSALVAVYEARTAARMRDAAARASGTQWRPKRVSLLLDPIGGIMRLGHWVRETAVATLCATAATASFMAYDFHELSPYVLIGNPLTLTLIEVFAVPGALIGTVLYPLGLDGPVWTYVGFGIDLVLAMARLIASAPGATLHLPAFAPWSLPFLSLAVLSMVVWRTFLLRLTALPFAAIGLYGALHGTRFDLAIPPTGDALAVRGPDGRLAIVGPRPNGFQAEQWLRADGDGRKLSEALGGRCDKLACVAMLPDGRSVSLVRDEEAFAEDCRRAAIIVTERFYVPAYCGAPLVISRKTLLATGAIGLALQPDGFALRTARSQTEDRPWSPTRRTAERDWPKIPGHHAGPASAAPGSPPGPTSDDTLERPDENDPW